MADPHFLDREFLALQLIKSVIRFEGLNYLRYKTARLFLRLISVARYAPDWSLVGVTSLNSDTVSLKS
jgi:hypothetical protein